MDAEQDRKQRAGRGLFVTGTDTGVGKTRISAGLMLALQRRGLQVLGMKPVAAGCRQTDDGLRNDDALLLQQQGSAMVDYGLVNPYALAPPVAPHLAAHEAGAQIGLERIAGSFHALAAMADAVVVEGAGGWLVPINARETLADVALHLQLEVVLVVGMRLGCINHALLTADSIQRHGCRLGGWVANGLDVEMSRLPQNILAIQQRLDAPLLGVVPYQTQFSAAAVADQLDIARLVLGSTDIGKR